MLVYKLYNQMPFTLSQLQAIRLKNLFCQYRSKNKARHSEFTFSLIDTYTYCIPFITSIFSSLTSWRGGESIWVSNESVVKNEEYGKCPYLSPLPHNYHAILLWSGWAGKIFWKLSCYCTPNYTFRIPMSNTIRHAQSSNLALLS